jgi:formimidoylglutamate deiminase
LVVCIFPFLATLKIVYTNYYDRNDEMIKHFFDFAFVQGKWAQNVLLSISADGTINDIVSNSPAGDAVKHRGYMVPGMPNLHSHAFQRAMAGLGELAGPSDDTFWSWRRVMYDFLQHLGPDEFQAIADQLYMEMLKAGFTSVGEFHYLHHQVGGAPYSDRLEMSHRVIAAAEKTGIGLTLLPVLYSYSGFGAQTPSSGQGRFINDVDQYLALVEALNTASKEKAGVCIGVAPHSLRATSQEQIKTVLDVVSADMPIHIHIAEQMKEVDDCIAWSGQRPVEWLANQVELDERWCLVHATHVTEAEIKTIATAGAVVGLCPITEANLGDGLFPVNQFMNEKGSWGIGSDSNINISSAEELRTLEYGQRLLHQKRTLIAEPGRSNGDYLYDAACRGGRRVLNPGQKAGLQIGTVADFVILKDDHPALIGKKPSQILDGWIFAGNNEVVKEVFVRGKQVVNDGHHIQEDSIKERFQRVMTDLSHKL